MRLTALREAVETSIASLYEEVPEEVAGSIEYAFRNYESALLVRSDALYAALETIDRTTADAQSRVVAQAAMKSYDG